MLVLVILMALVYIPGRSILELNNVSVQVIFVTSEMKLDTQCNKLCARVASGVAKLLMLRILEKLENIRKILNLVGDIAKCQGI